MKASPIFALIAGTTVVRLAFAATTGLGVDESYMVTAGRVLCLGYFDHPPASWWLSWGAAHLFQTEAPWAVRLPFIGLFALSQVLVWRIALLAENQRAAFWSVVTLNLSPVFSVTTGTWVLPDGPMDAALLGAALCMLHALAAGKQTALGWWSATGLCAGLALFSKYSSVLTIWGAFLYLLTSRLHRHWLVRPEPYIAAGLALAVFSPVLVWNAEHGWVSFLFQGDRAAGLRFHPFLPIQTLAGEALFVLPWVWLPMMILFAHGLWGNVAWRHRLLIWLAAPPIVVFAIISAWSSQRILYHWAAPGYLMLFPLVGDVLARHVNRSWVRGILAGSVGLIIISLAAIATQIQFDWLGRSLSGFLQRDPTQEGLDWVSIRHDLGTRGLLHEGALIGALNWRDAGKIGYALGPAIKMLCLSRDSRQFGFASPLAYAIGDDVLLLSVEPSGPPFRWFNSVQVLPDTAVRLDGRVLKKVGVERGFGLRLPLGDKD
jgi:hypothetical protein